MAGPFYFKWVDATATTWDLAYKVNDEDVFSFSVSQSEGDFANFTVDIKNPRVGLLCATRKQWAWLSYEKDSVVTPLFFGRLLGIPNEIHKRLVTLVFVARPGNFNIQKVVFANSLKYAPYWDPVFIEASARGNPDTVLEARPELWHVDRVTHALSLSNIVAGEDGTVNFPGDEIIADSISIQLEGRPLRSVTINADVGWTQPAKGVVTLYDGAVISSFTADGLVSDWPKPDANLGGGWRAAVSDAKSVPDYVKDYNPERWVFLGTPPNVVIYNSDIEPGPEFTLPQSIRSPNIDYPGDILYDFHHEGITAPTDFGPGFLEVPKIPSDWVQVPIFSGPFGFATWNEKVLVPMWHAKVNLQLGYDAERKRTERLSFTLRADVQDIITLATEEESPIIAISGSAVDEPVDIYEPADVPIVDPTRRSYFTTDRGLESVEYLISLARSRLLLGARVVKISFDVPFDNAIPLTLRMSATINSPDLPAGAATGKIVAYSFSCDGNTGEMIGKVTIACTIGRGNTISASDGQPDYVDEDCLDHDIQEHTGEIVLIDGDDVGYSVPTEEINDDGLILTRPLRKEEVVISETFTNISSAQKGIIDRTVDEATTRRRAILNATGDIIGYRLNDETVPDTDKVKEALKNALIAAPTTLSLTLKPADGGPYLTEYGLSVTDLAIRKGIDLEICS